MIEKRSPPLFQNLDKLENTGNIWSIDNIYSASYNIYRRNRTDVLFIEQRRTNMTVEMRCGMSNKKQKIWSGSFSPAKAKIVLEDQVHMISYHDPKLDKILNFILRSRRVELGFMRADPKFAYVLTDNDIFPAEVKLSEEDLSAVATL